LKHLGALSRHTPFAIEGSQNSSTRLAKITGFSCLLGDGLMAMDRLLKLVPLTTKSIRSKDLLI
jgi:hypothetical protein